MYENNLENMHTDVTCKVLGPKKIDRRGTSIGRISGSYINQAQTHSPADYHTRTIWNTSEINTLVT